MKVSTFFALMAEYGTVEVPLDQVCEKYFGLAPGKAKERALIKQLPIAAHRLGTQKSPWMINLQDLAEHIDKQRAAAQLEWNHMNQEKAS